MDLSKAITLGRIIKVFSGKALFTEYVVKKLGPFFILVDIDTLIGVCDGYGPGANRYFAFHESEVMEQVEQIPLVARQIEEGFPGETFLTFLTTLLIYKNELENSQLYRNKQLADIITDLEDTGENEGEIRLSLGPEKPMKFTAFITKF